MLDSLNFDLLVLNSQMLGTCFLFDSQRLDSQLLHPEVLGRLVMDALVLARAGAL
jgi:hypothetical protein